MEDNAGTERALENFIRQKTSEGIVFYQGAPDSLLIKAEAGLSPFKFTYELKALYQCCNGAESDKLVFGIANFISLEAALDKRSEMVRVAEDFGLHWPPALFPIGEWNSALLLAILRRENSRCSEILYIDIGSGDLLATLEFGSLKLLLDVVTGTRDFLCEYGGSSYEAFNRLQEKKFPDRYEKSQKGTTSKNGVTNVFDIADPNRLPKSWF